jgi:hypothetical protein
MSNLKITRSACCSRHKLGKMLIRSNKVISFGRIMKMKADLGDRHTYSMDGTEWA